jgi:hypothetical protein
MVREEHVGELERRVPEWAEVAFAGAFRRTLVAGRIAHAGSEGQ